MPITCQGCRDEAGFEATFSMAFQPIVDVSAAEIFAHEALVRGPNAQSAASVLSQVNATNRYAFDQQCRTKAVELAFELKLTETPAMLSINFMPNAVYEPRACIRQTLIAAERFGLPPERIIFEFTETEKLDAAHILNILHTYREIGFKTAIDDFGAGFANIGLLTEFRPDIVKLDMALIRGIDADPARRSIVTHLVRLFDDLGITVVCEGIETEAELGVLQDLGVRLFQGYLLCRPVFEGFGNPFKGNYAAATSPAT
ncbi:EAL domain-containing protein [Paracoccus benzoatiresistens]|uniref:EAL domain-containing protein n=1 Tax=Paracoccus benzoatiresistens TaxID=2997341 RepID=A0ABT4JA80_9RHOB|nr:EAL domain-containing protein [Paracoccus sp. EF6]MCZ0964041.1 EAL domain-containing protein [Paracoccus sp. EF6]